MAKIVDKKVFLFWLMVIVNNYFRGKRLGLYMQLESTDKNGKLVFHNNVLLLQRMVQTTIVLRDVIPNHIKMFLSHL